MRGWFIPVVLLVAAVALPFVVPTYYVQFVSKAFIMGILAMALNLAVGHGGMVSLCHAAFFGLAGYVLALLSPGYDPASLLLTLPAAMLAAAAAALIIGALALRTRGVYFIMVTLAFGEMLFFLFHDTGIAGGSDGAYVNAKPEIAIAGHRLLDLASPMAFYFVVLFFLIATIAVLTMLVQSPFGHALAAARDNERRARSLGFPIYRIRLIAFVVSGAIAGLAGYFAAAQFGFVAPQMLGWHLSATVLVMVLIGGLRSVTGPLIGALVLIVLEEVLKASTDYWKLIEGLIIIVIVLALPGGVRQLWPMIFGERSNASPARQAAPTIAEGRNG
ncbi:MAG: branched-chain amino acid ABC transporter permease [Rhizobiales bacterium]|nr:branched-chain amino acid ABC transporter permease [Hyphomicrobiales bacterium]